MNFILNISSSFSNLTSRVDKNKIKSLVLYTFASFFTAIIGLLINPFLALGLSATDYAIIGYYSSFLTLLSPIIAFSLTSYYARNYFLLDEAERTKLLQTILSSFLVFGALMLVVSFVLYFFYHKIYVTSIPFMPYAIISFLPAYFGSFYNIYLLDLRMRNKSKEFAVVSICNSLIIASLSLLFVYYLPFGAIGRLCVLLFVSIVLAIYSLFKLSFEFSVNKNLLIKAYEFCWPLTLSAILSYFFIGIDRVFLSRINDMEQLGLYNVGLQISSYLAIFGTVLFQTFSPDLYKSASNNQHAKVVGLVIGVTLLSVVPNFIFISISKPLISLLTSGRYVESANYACLLCLKNITMTFAFLISDALVAYGLSRYELYNRAIGAVITVLLYYFLIDSFQFIGAAIVQSVSWFLMGLISLVFIMIYKKRIL